MKRNIKLDIESHEYAWFAFLLGECAKPVKPASTIKGWVELPAMVMGEWYGGRFVRIMQTQSWANKRNHKWPEKFSEAEATAFLICLEALPIASDSPAHLIRNTLIDQIHRQLLSNP